MWNAHAHTGNTCANIQHPNAVCVCHCCGYYYVYYIPEKVDGPVNVAKRASRVTTRVAPYSQVGPGLPRDRHHHHTAARQDASSIIATVDVPPAQVPKEMPGLRRMSLQILAKNRLLLPSTTILDAHVQKTDGQVARLSTLPAVEWSTQKEKILRAVERSNPLAPPWQFAHHGSRTDHNRDNHAHEQFFFFLCKGVRTHSTHTTKHAYRWITATAASDRGFRYLMMGFMSPRPVSPTLQTLSGA